MNLLAVIEKLEEEWNKARLSVCTCSDVAINESCAVCSYESNALGFQPALLAELKEAIDLIETLEKVYTKYPILIDMGGGKIECPGNPCTEFLKKWTTE